jgi:hypothetical protein
MSDLLSGKKTFHSLQDVGGLALKGESKPLTEKDAYQLKVREGKFKFRMMISKKNRKWLKSKKSPLEPYTKFDDVYKKIEEIFNTDSKRKWLLHIITNFFPLTKAKQVTRLAVNKNVCAISGFELTDVNGILTGNRDKHIAYTGEKTNVVLSGIALQELERFVIDCTHNFDTKAGHIVNYAIDELRVKEKKD